MVAPAEPQGGTGRASRSVCALGVCRAQLANLLKEHCLVAGGDSNVTQWLKDEGVDVPLGSILKVRPCLPIAHRSFEGCLPGDGRSLVIPASMHACVTYEGPC